MKETWHCEVALTSTSTQPCQIEKAKFNGGLDFAWLRLFAFAIWLTAEFNRATRQMGESRVTNHASQSRFPRLPETSGGKH